MKHWETHLYGYAVALTQGNKIKPENLEVMRRKAITHGHLESECRFVDGNAQLYINSGATSHDQTRNITEVGA